MNNQLLPEPTYIHQYYGVPADIGRRVSVNGRDGIIVNNTSHYLEVNFDDVPANYISRIHPTDNVEYGEMGKIRKMTPGQKRYRAFLAKDSGESFSEFLGIKSSP